MTSQASEIKPGEHATIKVYFADPAKYVHQLDVTEHEASQLAASGRPIIRRKDRVRNQFGRYV